MATFTKFNSFVEAVAEKKHNLGSDQLAVALCASANAPSASNTVLGDLTQISYTNCSSRNLTTNSSQLNGSTYELKIANLVLTASGGAVATFRYVVIYNDTAANDELIGFFDYGASSVTLAEGETLTIDLSGVSQILLTLA
jgi:hypothetical protein